MAFDCLQDGGYGFAANETFAPLHEIIVVKIPSRRATLLLELHRNMYFRPLPAMPRYWYTKVWVKLVISAAQLSNDGSGTYRAGVITGLTNI